MTTVTTAGLDQLHDPDRDGIPIVLSVDVAQQLAREVLDGCAAASIHSHRAMMEAAVSLDLRLRSLLAALDAEEGR
ncbi:hypothetical protein [Streptomyces sp. NPDC058548]|uniref:hypothetical protein n=1 Tax=Streptomyces sp. NPDC058548 TaxID=3346545 RepID=UPI003651F049